MDTIIQENKDGVIIITINRPNQLNALNHETLDELNTAFIQLESEKVKGVVITGSGEKAFVAGADINEIEQLNGKSGHAFSIFGQSVFNRIEKFSKPVIAYINGYALGGGLELAMACHLRIACEKAKMGQPETKLGVIPGYGGTQRLPRLIGQGRALELILTGKMINAELALQYGLINMIAKAEEGLEKSIEFIEQTAKNAPGANSRTIKAVTRGMQMGLEEALEYEATLFGLCCSDEEKEEGTKAFLEKREANFK